MKLPILTLIICSLMAVPTGVLADDTNADCHVRENGKDKIKKTGPCNVFEARGHVWILLPTGDWWVLKPKNKADRYVDHKGKDVKREYNGDKPVYRWAHRHITVTANSG